MFVYNPDLSNLALQHMNFVKFNDLSRISEEGDTILANSKSHPAVSRQQSLTKGKSNAYRRDTYPSLMGDTEAKLTPNETASVVSEQVSIFL